MQRVFVLGVMLSGFVWLFNCGGEQAKICDPGSTQICTCASVSKGVQTCNDLGSSWGECKCLTQEKTGKDIQEKSAETTGEQRSEATQEVASDLQEAANVEKASEESVQEEDGGTPGEFIRPPEKHIAPEPDKKSNEPGPPEVGPEPKTCVPGCGICQVCLQGKCVPKAEGLPCTDDKNPCTSDVCSGGTCKHLAKADGLSCVDDKNPCTLDLCKAGKCEHPPKVDGVSCPADTNPCTSDICQGGMCKHPNQADGFACGANKVCKQGTCKTKDPCDGVNCHGHGQCSQGVCNCQKGYASPSCNACISGYTGYPNCVQCGQKNQPCCTGSSCQSSLTCKGGTCQCTVCQPGAKQCTSSGAQECTSDGCSWKPATSCSCGCAKGSCVPCTGVLVDGLGRVESIVVDSKHIYWAGYNNKLSQPARLKRSDLLGQNVKDLIKAAGSLTAVAMNNTYVFTVGNNSSAQLYRVTKSNGAIIVLNSALINPFEMGIDSTHAFVKSGNALTRIPLAGGAIKTYSGLRCGTKRRLAIDNQNVYVTCSGKYDIRTDTWSSGTIYKIPKSGATPTKLATVTGLPGAIVIEGNTLFWGEFTSASKPGTGMIRKMSTSGGSITDLAKGLNPPRDLVVSGGTVYWTESKGFLRKISTSGGAYKTLHTDQRSMNAITVDSSFIYWSEYPSGSKTGGRILRTKR